MASWMNNLRNLGRQAPPRSNQSQPPSRNNSGSPSAYSPSSLAPPNMSTVPLSPSSSANTSVNDNFQTDPNTKKVPLFFKEKYAGFMVKGNFMTLAAKPALVEEGEWLAHQIVEQERLLSNMLACVQEPDRTTHKAVCNEQSCTTMSAGPLATYQWVDSARQPIDIPAPQYIKHIQTWIRGKVTDDALFPTVQFQTGPPMPNPQQVASDPNHWLGKSSGFPQRFENEIKNIYKQMFRCYAHLYWSHWIFFYEISAEQHLNTCFVHFINVGRSYNLLTEKDVQPMQPLIDLWIRRNDIPQKESNPGSMAAIGSASEGASGSSRAATPGSAASVPIAPGSTASGAV